MSMTLDKKKTEDVLLLWCTLITDVQSGPIQFVGSIVAWPIGGSPKVEVPILEHSHMVVWKEDQVYIQLEEVELI